MSNIGSDRALFRRKGEPPSPVFRAGEPVPCTGVYRVFHLEHRVSHDVTLLGHEAFPRCSKCRSEVRFQLLCATPDIAADPDFRSRKLFELPHPGELAGETATVA